MRYRRIVFQIWEILFLVEAFLQFMIQWRQTLAWINPLLVGLGVATISQSTRGACGGEGETLRHRRRRSGFGVITAALLLLCYRLTRF